jgi:FKBP-type peptidyl-prolyl cis-trans isomerase
MRREKKPTHENSAHPWPKPFTVLFMLKSGIKIVSEKPGNGPELKNKDRVRVTYDIQLNHGEFLAT